MARTRESLTQALAEIPRLREAFWSDLRVTGSGEELNQELERAGRVADFFELADLLCQDALLREESCGGHFRVEHQTEDGEALRDDARFAHVAAWEWKGPDTRAVRHEEPLVFENVPLQQRSYK
jgi:succinate dehydrogenase / fumarate reductase flavoprotein subunit